MKSLQRYGAKRAYLVADSSQYSKYKAGVPWWRDDGVAAVGSALLYAFVATSMSIINRFALKVFPLPTVLLLVQMTATIAILYPLMLAKVLNFPHFKWQRFQQLLGISFFYTANTAFALFGLKGMNLPMYTAVKRLTPMTILVIKAVWKKKWPPPRLTASVLLVVVGCIIAGIGDLTFDPWAYMFALSSVVTQSLYLLLVEFQGDIAGTSTSELLWYNALTSLPLLTAITAANGDFYRISEAVTKGVPVHGPVYFYVMVTAAATMGCLLNYSLFLCTMYTSALTTTIVGVLRGVVTILLGFLLDTVKFHILNVIGISINTLGGVWYTWLKYTEKYGSGTGGSSLGGLSSSSSKLAYEKVASDEPTDSLTDGGPEGHAQDNSHRC